jgi:phage terminase small subunit
MPNPGKPYALKVLSGSRRISKAGPAVSFTPLIEAPPAPDWLLNDEARKEWHRLVPILIATRLMNPALVSVLGHVCSLHGSIARSMAAGAMPKPALVAQYRLLLNDFGLTPAARDKVAAPSADAGNRFARNGLAGRPHSAHVPDC